MKKKYLPILLSVCIMSSCSQAHSPETSTTSIEETPESVSQKCWQEISPREIEGNPITLFADDWFELAAGHEGDMNLMTIAWGALGELWNRPVVTVYVSTSRYTNEFMDKNEYFTITHFPASMRKEMQYLGSVSGRDEDKVKGAGLTTEFTELGNPIFAESNLAIECRKIYSHPFDLSKMPIEQRQWYEERGIGVHVAYVGEILHVWKK